MKEHDEHSEFEILAGKYLAGETTPAEEQKLEAWVKASDENQAQFLEWKHVWRLLKSKEIDTDADQEWENIQKRLSGNEEAMPSVEPPVRRIILKPYLRIAAVVSVFLAVVFLMYLMLHNPEKELLASGAVVSTTLDDGTVITLNQNSKLLYPKKFNQNERRVKLEGDAFFEVAKKPDKPFLIETSQIEVKVLGTSFYVDARPEKDQVEVMVKNGKVELTAPGQKEVVLTAGQKGIYIKEQQAFFTETNNDDNFLAWKTGIIQFKDTELSQVVQVLNRTYSTHITLQNLRLENCRLTATFENASLDDALLVISETLDLEVNRTANAIILSGTGCE